MTLEERIARKRINFDRLAPFIQRSVDPEAAKGNETGIFGMKSLWDRYVVPTASNLYKRSKDKAGQNAYSTWEINSLLAPEETAIQSYESGGQKTNGTSDEIFPEHGEYYRTNGLPVARYLDSLAQNTNTGTSGGGAALPKTDIARLPAIASNKPGFAGRGSAGDYLRKAAIPAGMAILLAAALTAYMRRRKRRLAKKDLDKNSRHQGKTSAHEKTASVLPDSWVGAFGRLAVPELSLADAMFTARTPDDYLDVNEAFRQYAKNRMPNKFVRVNGVEQWPGDLLPTFSKPVFRPGDKVFPRNAGSYSPYARAVNVSYLQGMRDVSGEDDPSHPMVRVWEGLRAKRDPRAAYLTTLAASMLPDFKQDPAISPNIGNMSYRLPFVPGQEALDRNMSDADIRKWQESGLDKMYMDALVGQLNKYPALRNMASAFVNGGFGRLSERSRYGIENPMWDYSASAPTPYGSNVLYNVAHDIWNSNDGMTEKDKEIGTRAHYGELLRFADGVAPKVLRPDTVLGHDMLAHPEGGLLPTMDKIVGRIRPYFDKSKTLKDDLMVAVGKDTLNSIADNVRSKAEASARK